VKGIPAITGRSGKIAGKISAARKDVVASLEQKVNAMLHQVGMPNARLKVEVTGVRLMPMVVTM
jgi:DNA repair protein RecN (Recombination protein N)